VAMMRAGQFRAAATSLSGLIALKFKVPSWRHVTTPAAVDLLERLLSAFRASGLFDHAYVVCERRLRGGGMHVSQ